MKLIIAILLTAVGLPVAAAIRSAEVATLEDLSKRKIAFVWLQSEYEGMPPEEIRVRHYYPELYAAYKITNVSIDACGNKTYEGTLVNNGLSIPEKQYLAKLVDHSEETCLGEHPRAFLCEFTTIFRDDLKGTSEEVKYYGVRPNKPFDAPLTTNAND